MKVNNRGKRSKTLSEIKLVENIRICRESIESSKFVSHRAGMSEGLIQGKIHIQPNLNEGFEYS